MAIKQYLFVQILLVSLLILSANTSIAGCIGNYKKSGVSQSIYLQTLKARKLLDSGPDKAVLNKVLVLLDNIENKKPFYWPAQFQRVRYIFKSSNNIEVAAQTILPILKAMTRQCPQYGQGWVLLGYTFHQLGDLSNAQKSFDQLKKYKTNYQWQYINQARVFFDQGQYKNALNELNRGSDIGIDDLRVIRFTVRTLNDMGRKVGARAYVSAMQKLVKTILKKKDKQKSTELINVVLYAGGRYWLHKRMVLHNITELEKSFGEHPPLMLLKAVVTLRQGYRYTNKGVDMHTPIAIVKTLHILEKLKKKDNPKYRESVNLMMAKIYLSDRKFTLLKNLFQEAEKQGIYNADLRIVKVQSFSLLPNKKAELKELRYIKAHYPDYSNYVNRRIAMLTNKVSVIDEREHQYLRKIKANPSEAWNYGNYACFLLRARRNYKASIKYSKKALSLSNYEIARLTLASAYYHHWADLLINKKDKAQALIYYYKAISTGITIRASTSTCGFKGNQFITQAVQRTGLPR